MQGLDAKIGRWISSPSTSTEHFARLPEAQKQWNRIRTHAVGTRRGFEVRSAHFARARTGRYHQPWIIRPRETGWNTLQRITSAAKLVALHGSRSPILRWFDMLERARNYKRDLREIIAGTCESRDPLSIMHTRPRGACFKPDHYFRHKGLQIAGHSGAWEGWSSGHDMEVFCPKHATAKRRKESVKFIACIPETNLFVLPNRVSFILHGTDVARSFTLSSVCAVMSNIWDWKYSQLPPACASHSSFSVFCIARFQ